jgi:glycosyltransferase involved in cell wall biosynthesis
MNKKLSIIIPCYNEESTIEEIVKKVTQVVDLSYEIIIIDDYSTDNTRTILKNNLKEKIDKLILNPSNLGKGYSVRQGIKEASGEIILIQDADLEYDPNDYPKLLEPIINGHADVVYGSRFMGIEQKKVLYFWHTVGNKFLTILSNMFTNLNLTDMEVGYKVFRSKVLKDIKLNEDRFGFEPEITAKIASKNLRIYEVGITYHGRKYSEGKKITWRDGFSAIRCILLYGLIKKS